MVFLRYQLNARETIFFVIFLIFGTISIEVNSTKIAYTKPINGKTKVFKLKNFDDQFYDITETITPLSEMVLKTPSTTTTPSMFEKMEFAESSHALHTIKNAEEEKDNHEKPVEESNNDQKVNDGTEQTDTEVEKETTLEMANTNDAGQTIAPTSTIKPNAEIEKNDEPIMEIPKNDIDVEHAIGENANGDQTIVEHLPVDVVEEIPGSSEHEMNTTPEGTITSTTSKRPTPCTCGIFMTSQIKRSKNPYEPPSGKPVITNELDRIFPCNAVGQKQCQTKCLEAIVQHLPNSANILCATLDRDIRKERAYLYIKNCRNQWYNTNLAAGREYCCKDGQPYQCPLV